MNQGVHCPPELAAQIRETRLVVFDFDGVFTDNSVYVFQDGREFASEFPGDKKRRPVDGLYQFLYRVIVKRPDAGKAWGGGSIVMPVCFQAQLNCLRIWQLLTLWLALACPLAHDFVLVATSLNKRRFTVTR